MNSTNDNKTLNWIQQWIRQQQQQRNDIWFQQKNEMLILGLCCHLLNSLLKTMSYSRKRQQQQMDTLLGSIPTCANIKN